MRLKTALREICARCHPPLRLTPHQSILFCDIEERGSAQLLEEILRRHGVPLTEEISTVAAGRWPARPAHLRAGGHRKRTGAAGDDRSAGGRIRPSSA